MSLKIYRLEPVAPADDANWDRANDFGTVHVRAESPADARIVASEAEASAIEAGGGVDRATWSPFSSAFCDEKLYRADEDHSQRYSAHGGREVVSGITVAEAMAGPGGVPAGE